MFQMTNSNESSDRSSDRPSSLATPLGSKTSAEGATEPPASGPLRVLIADDDVSARDLIVAQLQQRGHLVVAQASSGREAVELARESTPDVAILDVHMPDGSGLEAAEQMAAALPEVAIVLFSGDASLILSERDVEATSALAFLPKPSPAGVLDATIRLSVAHARVLRSARREAADVSRRLADRKLIERAKGLLMRRTGLGEHEAYRILQRTSQDRSVPMSEIARIVVDGEPLHQSAQHRGTGTPPRVSPASPSSKPSPSPRP